MRTTIEASTPSAELRSARNHVRRAGHAISRFRNQWPHSVDVEQATLNTLAVLEEFLRQLQRLGQLQEQELPW